LLYYIPLATTAKIATTQAQAFDRYDDGDGDDLGGMVMKGRDGRDPWVT
jgi:hypothetical protein